MLCTQPIVLSDNRLDSTGWSQKLSACIRQVGPTMRAFTCVVQAEGNSGIESLCRYRMKHNPTLIQSVGLRDETCLQGGGTKDGVGQLGRPKRPLKQFGAGDSSKRVKYRFRGPGPAGQFSMSLAVNDLGKQSYRRINYMRENVLGGVMFMLPMRWMREWEWRAAGGGDEWRKARA